MTKSDDLIAAPSDNLRGRTLSGTVAVGASQAVKVAVQFISVVVLARLLSPEDIGLFAMVLPFASFVGLFQDLGLSQAIITTRTLSQSQASAMFWINVVISSGLGLLLCLLTPAIVHFYGRSELVWLTLGLAATLAASGFVTVQLALLNRKMRFGTLATIDAVSVVAGFMTAATVAVISPSAAALLMSTIDTLTVTLIMAWTLSSWRPSNVSGFKEISDLLKFGAGVTGFNVSNFFARNLDNVLIGRVSGAQQLGYYDRAYKLLVLPLQQVNRPLGQVLIPALSRLIDDPSRYRHAYLRVVQQTLLLITPGVLVVMIAADTLIPLLMGDQWGPTSAIFSWLALSGLHQPLTTTIGWLFISQGRTTEFARWGLINAVVCISAFLIGLPGGALGVARSYAIADTLLLAPAVWWIIGRRGPVRTADLVGLAAPFALVGATTGTLLLAASHVLQTSGVSGWPLLIILGASGYLAFAVALSCLKRGRAILAETLRLLQSAIAGAKRVIRR
nr:lipopolysaccharide biosynthesis protein [uncultured Brevundimonas sp.]